MLSDSKPMARSYWQVYKRLVGRAIPPNPSDVQSLIGNSYTTCLLIIPFDFSS
jgi:hypothetical protein